MESLSGALSKCLSRTPICSHKSVYVALYAQIAGKWKYAAIKYREENPGVLPESKHQQGTAACKHLLPIAVAEQKMLVWIPWAIQRVQQGFDQLVKQFGSLTVQQMAEVDAEGEDEVLENEPM